jgi:enamine deaminase RidA (YjgF/YER057c/UK114 family)
MSFEQRLKDLNMTLPDAGKPGGAYIRARQTGNLLYIAGHGPKKDGKYPALGKLGANVTLEQGRECARNCVLNMLASAREFLGTLDRITGVIKVNGYVASTPDFTAQPQVMNAASELLLEIFGEAGRHARTSVGMAVLPDDIPVEIEMILEIRD